MSKNKERIRDSALRYKQGLGQNFIYDEDLLAALVEASGVTAEDDVLEVGPGAGSMTKHLCRAAHHVLSVELDDRLIPLLGAFMTEYDNFTLVHGDVMQVNLPEITAKLRKPLCVVANIPYYITTPLMTMLLTSPLDIKQMSLMVQKEVADKVLAAPGDDAWGMLAVRCQYYCDPYLAMDVPAACFTPAPKVDSAFIVLPRREKPLVDVRCEEDFFRVAAAGFALRRKTMTNGLCAAFHMERAEAVALMNAAGLDERIRGEKLTFEELARLADAYTAWKEAHA
ncbi:MAG: ribosomal RNA small subunit methyltransferase A [Clostridia bacterium]|nr:ribosomal RNA small subunit methyltransferase A [Clostridia bacterium]